MLWLKTAHILGVVSWLAGLFYLPRLLINAREGALAGENVQRLTRMAVRLVRFTSFTGLFALAFGAWLWLGYDYAGNWLYAKLVLVGGLVAYHVLCWVLVRRLVAGRLTSSPLFLRIFNEASLLLVVPILILAVVRPI